jgi:O-acetylhomoserine (thiol)-lyase
VQLLRDLGPAVSPFNAFLIAQGIETLSLRMERHVANTQRVAEWLEARDEVKSVAYAGLPSSRWHDKATKYAPLGAGAVLAFEIEGGIEAGRRFVTRSSCTATSPTSATCAAWSSTRPRPRTRS